MSMSDPVVSGMTDFIGLCVIGFILRFAIGGNQSVDAILLIESISTSHQWLVATQGIFWSLGELVSYAIKWVLITIYACRMGPDEMAKSQTSALVG